jgi:hypothetical protein
MEHGAWSSRTNSHYILGCNMEPKRANNVVYLMSEFYMDTQAKNKKTYLCMDLSLIERDAPITMKFELDPMLHWACFCNEESVLHIKFKFICQVLRRKDSLSSSIIFQPA